MQRFVERLSPFVLASVTAVTLTAVSGCGSDTTSANPTSTSATVAVTDAIVNKPVSGQPTAGVYAVVTNDTANDVTIVGATSPVSDNVQLHLTVDGDGGTSSMQEIDSIDIAAGDTYRFESGGAHIMLMDVDPASFPEGSVEVTLELDDGTSVPFTAAVSTLESSAVDKMDQESVPTESTTG